MVKKEERDNLEESQNLYNEAVEKFRVLNKLSGTDYLNQLKDIVWTCIHAIKINEMDGDSHILLANAYLLIAESENNFKSINFAAAVIVHWKDASMSQYPYSKNTSNGRELSKRISDDLTGGPMGYRGPKEIVIGAIEALEKIHYADAISNQSLDLIFPADELAAKWNRWARK
jgi:hypothetical protein